MIVPPELSAIVLCYRAGDSILNVIRPLYGELERAGVPFEVVLVANYWPADEDPTPAVVAEFAESRPHVRTVVRTKEGGMGWDMRAGFAAARGEYMIVLDGDGQNPIESVLSLYHEMKRTQADVGKGRRIARFDGPYRRIVSYVYNALFLVLFGTRNARDINGKPKGLTRRAYEMMDLRSDDWFIDAEIVLQAQRLKLRLVEIPIVFRRNDVRDSFVRPGAIPEFLLNMLRARVRRP